MLYTADQTVVTGIRYGLPLAKMAESLVFNLDYYWSDRLVKADLFLPSYDITNFRVDLYGVGGKQGLDLGFYVRNLFDDEIQLSSGASSVALGFASVTYAAWKMISSGFLSLSPALELAAHTFCVYT